MTHSKHDLSQQDEILRLKEGWARSDHMLRRVYNKLGPKHVKPDKRTKHGRFSVFPTSKFAAMTRKQIDKLWDFPDLHFMHAIAKTLEDKP